MQSSNLKKMNLSLSLSIMLAYFNEHLKNQFAKEHNITIFNLRKDLLLVVNRKNIK